MVKNKIEIETINSDNIIDRLKLCWGHLENWRKMEIVKKSREWLEKANSLSSPTTLIAYRDGAPVGMIEFIPYKLLNKVGLCPCRVDTENKETEERYFLGDKFENHIFISCLFVSKYKRHQGVGKTLLKHFLNSEISRDSDGILIYVTKRDEKWSRDIHWPAGPKEFYLKNGFHMEKKLEEPLGYILRTQMKRK